MATPCPACDLQIPFPTKRNQDSLEKWLYKMIQEHYAIPDSKEVVKATAIVSKGLRSQLRGVPTGAKDFNIANVFRSMSSQWYQKKKKIGQLEDVILKNVIKRNIQEFILPLLWVLMGNK